MDHQRLLQSFQSLELPWPPSVDCLVKNWWKSHTWEFQQKLLSFGLLLLVFEGPDFVLEAFVWDEKNSNMTSVMICLCQCICQYSPWNISIAVPVSAISPGAPRSAKGCKASALTQPLWEQPCITTHPPWDSKKCTPLPEQPKPLKRGHPKSKKKSFNYWFSGAMLVLGSVSLHIVLVTSCHFLCILTFLAASAWSERATPSALCHWCHTPLPRACLQRPPGWEMKQMALRTEMSENVVPPPSLANIPRGQPQERPGDPVT